MPVYSIRLLDNLGHGIREEGGSGSIMVRGQEMLPHSIQEDHFIIEVIYLLKKKYLKLLDTAM